MSYSAVPGFFVQDPNDLSVDPAVFGALPARLGLIDDSPSRWDTFREKISQLNVSASMGTSYKVFFLGRHGQGIHNVGESKYGTKAWDNHWSTLDGDDELTWGPDPPLTALGQAQAVAARDAWKSELLFRIPLPEKCYASPLKRALDTWTTTFGAGGDEAILPDGIRKVTIVENCREEYGEHTCDRRSTKSALAALYPSPTYTFEPGFAEEDPLWTKERETKAHVAQRAREVLDYMFKEPETYVSITAHSGFINGFLAVLGRTSYYPLPTGGILPVVVKYTPT